MMKARHKVKKLTWAGTEMREGEKQAGKGKGRLREAEHDRGAILVGDESAKMATCSVDLFEVVGVYYRQRHGYCLASSPLLTSPLLPVS